MLEISKSSMHEADLRNVAYHAIKSCELTGDPDLIRLAHAYMKSESGLEDGEFSDRFTMDNFSPTDRAFRIGSFTQPAARTALAQWIQQSLAIYPNSTPPAPKSAEKPPAVEPLPQAQPIIPVQPVISAETKKSSPSSSHFWKRIRTPAPIR